LISATKNELLLSNFLNVAGYALGASANVQSRVTDKLLNLTDLPVTTPPANFFQIDEDDTAILAKAGIATTDIINVTFVAYTASIQLNLTKEESESIDDASIIQLGLNTFLTVSEQFNLKPEESDPLYWDFKLALSKPNDGSVATPETFITLFARFLREHDDSVTWFPASAGGSLIITALLRYLGQTPYDRWEWIQTLTIGFSGVGYSLLSVLDIGSRKQIIDFDEKTFDIKFNSAIFKFEDSGLVLPSFAVLNVLLLIAIGVQKYLRNRKNKSPQVEEKPVYSISPLDRSYSSIQMLPLTGNNEARHMA